MADITTTLLNAVDPSTTGTFYSSPVFDTKDYRDFAFVLSMPSQSGTSSDLLDVWIEQSSEKAFTNAHKTTTLTLTAADGTTATQFTQVAGNLTLPSDTHTSTNLRQVLYFPEVNIGRYIRVKYTVVGTATNLTDITLDVLCNRKV